MADRRVVGLLAGLVLVAGCGGREAARAAPPAGTAQDAPVQGGPVQGGAGQGGAAPEATGLHLAYTHEIGLELPAALLGAHLQAARAHCLDTPALHCVLLRADLEAGKGRLVLLLPYNQVAGFSAFLTAVRPGEPGAPVRVVRQASEAAELGQKLADSGQRVAELTQYLAALKVLGARLTISVSDQVKVAEETARAQSQLEEVQARAHELSLRTGDETLDASFAASAPAVAPAGDPVSAVLAGAEASLRRNLAMALGVVVAAVGWLPAALLGLAALWVVRLVVFGRRRLRA